MVDRVVKRHGTAEVAKGYLEYLYTRAGPQVIARNFYRPRDRAVAAKYKSQFASFPLFTVDEQFGGWTKARKTFFADGGVFDQIQQGGNDPGQEPRMPGFPTRTRVHAYLLVIVVAPLATIFFKSVTLTWREFWATITAPRTLAACRLSFVASLAAALVNSVFGTVVAWTLVRYEFPAQGIIDAMVELPFARPTSVAGITRTAIYATNGWIGGYFEPMGIRIAFTPLDIVVAVIFVGRPLVVRTLKPVLEELDLELEEAAATLGANRLQTLVRVTFPGLTPALLTGFALANARAIGEYVGR